MNVDGTVKDSHEISAGDAVFGGTIAADDAFGLAVAGIGDLDGDGLVDLVVAAPQADDAGAPVLGLARGALFVPTLETRAPGVSLRSRRPRISLPTASTISTASNMIATGTRPPGCPARI